MRYLKFAFFAAVCCFALGTAALAAVTGSSALDVHVAERSTDLPIASAHVTLESDTRLYDGYTDSRGDVHFVGLRHGEYLVTVSRHDYAAPRAVVDLGPGAAKRLLIVAVRTRLRQIAMVAARHSHAKGSRVAAGGTAGTLAGSVGGALALLPEISSGSTGPLQIGGHAPSSTGVSVDGASIFPSGFQPPSALVNADIFQNASLDQGATLGSPAGSVSFSTFDPTIDWQGELQLRGASYGGASQTAMERGTAGRVGLSLVHSVVQGSDALQGLTFADTSGMHYSHDRERTNIGDAVTLRYPLGEFNVLHGDVGSLSLREPMLCDFRSGGLPCGYGPGTSLFSRVHYVQLRDDVTLDRFVFGLDLFRARTEERLDLTSSSFLGVPTPSLTSIEAARSGIRLRGQFLMRNGSAITLDAASYADTARSASSLYLGPSLLLPPTTQAFKSVSLDVPIIEGKRADLHAAIGSQSTSENRAATLGLDARAHLSPFSTLSLTASLGNLAASTSSATGVSDASSFRFDCGAGRALGQGPVQGSIGDTSDSYRATYALRRGNSDLRLSAYDEVQHGPLVVASVPGDALPSSLFGSGYLNGIESAATTICGSPQRLTTSTLYFSVGGVAASERFRGIDADVTLLRTPRARVRLSAALTSARAVGLPPQLERSIDVASDRQLPHVSPYRFSLSGAFALRSRASLLAMVNAFGPNNAYRQTPFVDYDAGMRLKTPSGNVVFSVQNITGAASPTFNHFTPFPYVTQPFIPRTYAVRYQFDIGNRYVDHTPFLSEPQFVTPNNVFFIPVPFEGTRHAPWLAVDTASPVCGPELVPRAKTLLQDIRRYRDRAAAAFKSGAMLAPSVVDGMTLSMLRAPRAYAIRIELPDDARLLAP